VLNLYYSTIDIGFWIVGVSLFGPEDFIWFLVRCRKIEKDGGDIEPIPSEFFRYLTIAWEELSFAYRALDPEHSLEPAAGNPGYLFTRCEEWIVFVPWSLVATFPGPQVLASLLKTGKGASIRPANNLCISGSSAWLGGNIIVGDIDYCQYVESLPASIAESVENFTHPTKDLILLKASYGDREVEPPWPEKWPPLANLMGTHSRDSAEDSCWTSWVLPMHSD
jgi:hypothetical protein